MTHSTDASNPLAGTWVLVTAHWTFDDDKALHNLYGDNPVGFAILTTDGRMMAILTERERPPEAGPAASFAGMMAYSGRYRLQGHDAFVTRVDAAWHPSWIGSDQLRTFQRDGDTLILTTAPQEHPMFPNRRGRGVLTWRKE